MIRNCRIFHLLILVFLSLSLEGQNREYQFSPKVDSLIMLIRSQRETNPELAYRYLDTLSTYLPNFKTELQPYLKLLEGEILIQQGKIEPGLEQLNRASDLFLSIANQTGVAYVEEALTRYYTRTANYPKALESAFKVVEIREQNGDRSGLVRALVDIADIYWYYQRFDEGLKYAHQALELVKDLPASKEKASVYKILSELYLEIPDYLKALESIDKAIEISKSQGATDLEIASTLNSRGNVYKYLKRYDDALQDYNTILNACTSADYKICMRVALANVGHIYLILKDYTKAIEFKKRALEIQTNTGEIQQVAENILHLSEAYAGLGNMPEAYKYRVKLDSINQVEHQQALDKLTNELSVKYETEKKEESIKSLNERVRFQKISIAMGSTLLIISLIATSIFIRLKNRLQRINQEKELLMREIHHRTKNNLQILSSLLSLQTDHLHDAHTIDVISEGRNRVESMGMIHQRLYSGDNPTSVDLQEYLPELCRHLEESFSASNKIISIKEDIRFGDMDVDYAIPLGLIINELVTNSVKYGFSNGDKGQISLLLKEMQGELLLSVSDDGTGVSHLKKDEMSTSFGSMLIETLSKKLKGRIEINRENGYNTTIIFQRYRN